MQQSALELLKEIYNHYLETDDRQCSVSFIKSSPQEKKSISNSLDYLEECGYIQYTARATGFRQFKITVIGINFAENGYKELEISPVVQGPNSIYVNGSGNSISDNYNQISMNISQTDLPEECKQLIESFLYEMKNPNLTPEKKTDKIKSFLCDISSGTISGIAASGLTALLSSLFTQISF